MTSDIELYTTYTDTDFVAEIPRFIKSAEERIWYFVQLPYFQRNVTGTFTSGNAYLQLPDDFLAAASLAIVTPVTGEYVYLLPKDVSYIREVYPVAATTGVPTCYALFTADEDDTTIIVGPTPAAAYVTQLNYFYKPASLVDQPTGTWLSINAYDTLLMGALSESAVYLKKTAGIDSMGDTYEQRFLVGLQGLKNLGETRDKKDTYRNGEKRGRE
mgnify:CR=1 FL=1|tara:strand:- start:1604 stop:2248 length:645 start_codon:yes stop_codon:yes gene_type:complete